MFKSYKIIKQSVISKRLFSYSARILLTKENKKKCIKKFQDMLISQGSRQTVRRAAVLIPVYVKDDEVSLVYTLRAASLRTHRGQISFPGGMVDQNDKSIEETALRETQEELGIKPEDVEIWGSGNPIVRQEMAIVPVIGNLKEGLSLNKLKLNPDEVEEIFTVRIQDLTNVKYNKHTQFRGSYSTPTYFGGPYRIWGLTAVMTFMFLKSFLPKNIYNYNVHYIPNISKVLNDTS